MYNNDEMSEKAKILARKVKRRIHRQPYQEVTEITPLFIRNKLTNDKHEMISEPFVKLDESVNDDCATSPWKIPGNSNVLLFLLRWPITLTLWCTIPDSRRFKRFYVFSFINCVFWIGLCSYFIVFVSTDVGEWLFIHICYEVSEVSLDSVMGLTFLAAGTSIPEAVSSVIVTAQGHGSMGISNSIGSNTFDILLCLGLPWLIKTLIAPTNSGQPWVRVNSTLSDFSFQVFRFRSHCNQQA